MTLKSAMDVKAISAVSFPLEGNEEVLAMGGGDVNWQEREICGDEEMLAYHNQRN